MNVKSSQSSSLRLLKKKFYFSSLEKISLFLISWSHSSISLFLNLHCLQNGNTKRAKTLEKVILLSQRRGFHNFNIQSGKNHQVS